MMVARPSPNKMKYICHGCGTVYDDEIGYPIRCPKDGKIIRHKLEDEYWYNKEEDK
jgi:DNA-directed RNA polymerase subunit RPC12/RpoP